MPNHPFIQNDHSLRMWINLDPSFKPIMLTFNFSILQLHKISHPLHQLPVYPNIHSQVEFFLLFSFHLEFFFQLISYSNKSIVPFLFSIL